MATTVNKYKVSDLAKDFVDAADRIADTYFTLETAFYGTKSNSKLPTVENGVLYLKNENIRYWIRDYDYPLEIKIYHNSIRKVNYESWGDLTSEGYVSQDTINRFDIIVNHGSGHIDVKINCNILNIATHDGTAKVTVSGTSGYANIYHNARNNIYAKDLVSKDACAHVHYEGSVYVNCTDSLAALVNNFGSIYYNKEVKMLNDSITPTPVPNSRGVIEAYN